MQDTNLDFNRQLSPLDVLWPCDHLRRYHYRSVTVKLTHHCCQKSNVSKQKIGVVWCINVCKSRRCPERGAQRAHEGGELGIQRDDVASRERVYWEPIRIERLIIPMTRWRSTNKSRVETAKREIRAKQIEIRERPSKEKKIRQISRLEGMNEGGAGGGGGGGGDEPTGRGGESNL